MIIGLAGKKGSGKDTLGNYIINQYGFIRYAFGDPVKEICRILFNFNNEQLYGSLKEEIDPRFGFAPRETFQKIGTDFGRNYFQTLFPQFDNNLWIDIFRRQYQGQNVVITDIRFQNEVDTIRSLGGKVILINKFNGYTDNHPSEQINVTYDYIINNNGSIQELWESFDKLNIL